MSALRRLGTSARLKPCQCLHDPSQKVLINSKSLLSLEQQTPTIRTDSTGNDSTTRWGDKIAALIAALLSLGTVLILNVLLSKLAVGSIARRSRERDRDAPYCSSDPRCCCEHTPAGKFSDHGKLQWIRPGTSCRQARAFSSRRFWPGNYSPMVAETGCAVSQCHSGCRMHGIRRLRITSL